MSSATINTTKATNEVNATGKNLRDLLLEGAKVHFGSNGTELVYTVEGVKGLEISAKGYIIDKGVVKHPKPSNDTVYIGRRDGCEALNIAFKTLVTMLNGYLPRGGVVIARKEDSLGWTPNNIILVDKFTRKETSFDLLSKIGEVKLELDFKQDDSITGEDLYTRKEQVMEYITEDGAAFPTRELAEWHQANVTEAKGLAQVVLDYNGGYVIAEKVYQEKVVYNKERPYKNFRDVMDNDKGIVERKSKEVVKFNKFAIGGDPKFAYLFSDKSYSQEKADEIVAMLSLAREVYENLDGLSKQTV